VNLRAIYLEEVDQARREAFDYYVFVRNAYLQNLRARTLDGSGESGESDEPAPGEGTDEDAEDLYYFDEETLDEEDESLYYPEDDLPADEDAEEDLEDPGADGGAP